jgi:hypothetical protein
MAVGRFSTPFQPHEYTNPFDLGTYATLITERQRLYDTNLKAMSGQLSKYTNIPISRDVDKQYIGEKITGLNQNVNSLGAQDYSDPNVVSRISSIINGFAEDPRIKNALLSSNQMMKDEAEIEAAKKNKTYSQQNEWEVRLSQNDYMKSTDANAVYQSPKYQPYTGDALLGVKAFATDINAKGEASIVTADGKTVKYKKSQLTAEVINQILPNLVTPEAFAQLRRDALWTHRGLSTDPINPNFGSTKDFVVNQMSGKVRKQMLFAASKLDVLIDQIENTKDENLKEELKSQKEALSNQITTYEGQLKNGDYLFNEGSKKDVFQSLITDAYTNQRLGSLGLIYAVSDEDISAIGGGAGKGKVQTEVTTNYTYNQVNVENAGNYTKNSILSTLNSYKQKLGDVAKPGSMMMNIISDMKTQNPTLYGGYSQAEMIKAYQAKEKAYAEGNLTGDENQMFRKHFAEVSNLKSEYDLFSQLQNTVESNLESKPEYAQASNGLKASEKLLKPYYDIPVQNGLERTTKRYSKQAVLNYMRSLESMGSQPGRPWEPTSWLGKYTDMQTKDLQDWFNRPLMDIEKPLMTFGSDDELIKDVNAGMKQMKNEKDKLSNFDRSVHDATAYYAQKGIDFITSPLRPFHKNTLGGPSLDYVDPVFELISNDSGFEKHITTRREYARTVKDLEDATYKELGYIEMNPTFNVNLKPEIQQANTGAVGNLVRQHGIDDDEKSRAVESWTGIRSVPGNQVEFDYTFKDDKATKSATLRVPREVAGGFEAYIPKDDTRAFEAAVRKVGATTSDPVKAPKMQWGNVIIPYRITYNRSEDAFQLQVFQSGKLIDKYTDNLKFKSINDFYANKDAIARQVAELTNRK